MTTIKVYNKNDLTNELNYITSNLCTDILKQLVTNKPFVKIYFGTLFKQYSFLDKNNVVWISSNKCGFSQMSLLKHAKCILLTYKFVFVIYAEPTNIARLRSMVDESVILIPTSNLFYKKN
jgi:hypothetical protein